MKNVLFISNHAGFSKFNAPYMKWFHEKGWRVENVSPGIETGYYDEQHNLNISRNPFSIKNIIALIKLRKICKKGKYDLIHCHTPVGGVLGRLCAKYNRNDPNRPKILYTAHGFHFYKGANIFYWLLFYPIEKLLAKRTDIIITINQEDYSLAKKYFSTRVERINGVGVSLDKFKPVSNIEKILIRENNGFLEEDFIIIYCAQFIKRKNHKFILYNLKYLKDKIPNIKICFVGNGKDEIKIKKIANKLRLSNFVYFMGYRKDVNVLYAMSDLLISASKQEGFPLNIVEGMACGLPVVCSNIRGHRDIVSIAKGNILFDFKDNSFIKAILDLYKNSKKREEIGKMNIEYAKQFSIENSLNEMEKIYLSVMQH